MNIAKYLDSRMIWSIRHVLYKLWTGQMDGLGYIGKPIFTKGLHRLYVKKGFGLFPGARIEILNGKVNIGENVRIGNNFMLNCGSNVSIGSNVTISANVFVGTTDHIVDERIEKPFSTWEKIERPIIIGEGCFLGYGSVVLPGTELEDGCVVGANAVVKGRFTKGSVVAGNPGKIIRNRKKNVENK